MILSFVIFPQSSQMIFKDYSHIIATVDTDVFENCIFSLYSMFMCSNTVTRFN